MFLYTLEIMSKYFRFLPALIVVTLIAYLWLRDDGGTLTKPPIELIQDIFPVESDSLLRTESNLESDSITVVNQLDQGSSTKPIDGVEIMGRVEDQLGQGISSMKIEVTPKNTVSWEQKVYTAVTDHRGEFLIEAIPPGKEYRLEVLAAGTFLGSLVDFFPIDKDITSLAIILDSIELTTVDGMIVDVDSSPIADFEILIQNVGIAYPGRAIISDSSGFFRLDQFPTGDLQLSTRGDNNFKITGIKLTGEYKNLTLVLDRGNYYLSGWVRDEFDAPISQARVSMTSEFTHDDYHSSSYRFRVTDSNGRFVFSDVGGQGHQLSIDAIGYKTQRVNYRFSSFSDDLKIKMELK
jgi:hypothetical protein